MRRALAAGSRISVVSVTSSHSRSAFSPLCCEGVADVVEELIAVELPGGEVDGEAEAVTGVVPAGGLE